MCCCKTSNSHELFKIYWHEKFVISRALSNPASRPFTNPNSTDHLRLLLYNPQFAATRKASTVGVINFGVFIETVRSVPRAPANGPDDLLPTKSGRFARVRSRDPRVQMAQTTSSAPATSKLCINRGNRTTINLHNPFQVVPRANRAKSRSCTGAIADCGSMGTPARPSDVRL